jgi:hypothetical protein
MVGGFKKLADPEEGHVLVVVRGALKYTVRETRVGVFLCVVKCLVVRQGPEARNVHIRGLDSCAAYGSFAGIQP